MCDDWGSMCMTRARLSAALSNACAAAAGSPAWFVAPGGRGISHAHTRC
jgi:hypothetical protein